MMVDTLSDQLSGLLSLEGNYLTRDYLLDVVCGKCFEHEEDKENNKCFSLTSSSSKNKALVIVQHAVDWREKICKWSYQGKFVAYTIYISWKKCPCLTDTFFLSLSLFRWCENQIISYLNEWYAL